MSAHVPCHVEFGLIYLLVQLKTNHHTTSPFLEKHPGHHTNFQLADDIIKLYSPQSHRSVYGVPNQASVRMCVGSK